MKQLLGAGLTLIGLVGGIAAAAAVYDVGWNESDWFQELWVEAGRAPLSEADARTREIMLGASFGILTTLSSLWGLRLLRR